MKHKTADLFMYNLLVKNRYQMQWQQMTKIICQTRNVTLPEMEIHT